MFLKKLDAEITLHIRSRDVVNQGETVIVL